MRHQKSLGMVNPHCQFAWVWNHVGDTSLSLSLRMFPERSTWEGKTRLEYEWCCGIGWSPRLNKNQNKTNKKGESNLSASIDLRLLPECRRFFCACPFLTSWFQAGPGSL